MPAAKLPSPPNDNRPVVFSSDLARQVLDLLRGLTNPSVNGAAFTMVNGRWTLTIPPSQPPPASTTLFTVIRLPDNMPGTSGSGSGSSTNGVQLKTCYVIATKVSDTSASPTPYLVRVVYPHAVGDAFYAQQPDGGAGWAYQHTWYSSDPTAGSGDGTFPPTVSGSGSGAGEAVSGSGLDEFTTADPIAWIEQYASWVNSNATLVQDGGTPDAPTYSIYASYSTPGPAYATGWSPQSRLFQDNAGFFIYPASGGHVEFDSNGEIFISSTDEQYAVTVQCQATAGSGSGSGD